MIFYYRYFMAVCDECHKDIHRNPAWARGEGYLVNMNMDEHREAREKAITWAENAGLI